MPANESPTKRAEALTSGRRAVDPKPLSYRTYAYVPQHFCGCGPAGLPPGVTPPTPGRYNLFTGAIEPRPRHCKSVPVCARTASRVVLEEQSAVAHTLPYPSTCVPHARRQDAVRVIGTTPYIVRTEG